MAKRKATQTERPKTVLIKPREVFRKELLQRITEGEALGRKDIRNTEQLTQLNQEATGWDNYNKELIKRAFNHHDNEYHYKYARLNGGAGLYDYLEGVDTNSFVYKSQLSKEKISNCLTGLSRLIDILPLIEEEGSMKPYLTAERTFYNRGFVVHGHHEERKYEVARFIENDLHKKAIILHEQANKGQTIIEKFESYAEVDFAVALWTADDIGKAKEEEHPKDRARQNVILETGFFLGKIGRKNVIVLYEDGVEIPSDYSGVIFIALAGNWKDDLRREIDAIYENL